MNEIYGVSGIEYLLLPYEHTNEGGGVKQTILSKVQALEREQQWRCRSEDEMGIPCMPIYALYCIAIPISYLQLLITCIIC